ncbi:MAG TPA: hypothetical protein VFX21_14170 [Acidimicrobiia bacterium]|nr:hypothetical protein [Acidimicrobiia bacterium]
MTTRPSIAFDANFRLQDLSRQTLAILGREWLLHGHLQDRIAMPLVLTGRSRDVMEAVAIDEWMGASPIYSKRVQRALRFEGDGVDTIMKNLQLDIGSPHHFMDFRCTVHDHDHGEFFLAHCGALMDVEPMGEDFVRGMCHAIEDPTFDATAGATNPRAQMRPVHRPPRVPADRQPHCHWTVTIDPAHEPASVHPNLAVVTQSLVPGCAVEDPGDGTEPGGWDDYAGPFDTDFALEDLSQRALVVALQEVALQSHILVRSLCVSIANRLGADVAREIAPNVAVGLAGLTAERLTAAFDFGADAPGLAALLTVHPMFWPRTYVQPVIAVDGNRVRFALRDESTIFAEADDYTWLASVPGIGDRILLALAQGFDRRAQVATLPPGPGERCAYELTIDPATAPAREQREVSLGKISTGAAFVLEPRRPVRI